MDEFSAEALVLKIEENGKTLKSQLKLFLSFYFIYLNDCVSEAVHKRVKLFFYILAQNLGTRS